MGKLIGWLKGEKSFAHRLTVFALILRLIPIMLLRGMGIGLDDMFQYDMLARSIEAGNGYRWYAEEDLHLAQQYIAFEMPMESYDPRGVLTSFRPPLYPFFLSMVYFIFGTGGNRFFIARIVQAILSALLVALTYDTAKVIFPEKKKVKEVAAWIVAVYPMLVLYPLSLATENLFFVLFMSSLNLAIRCIGSRRTSLYIFTGMLLGLTALTRSVALAMAGMVVLWLWIFLRERKNTVLMFLMICVVVSPWMIRNSLLHNRLVGIESALGYDLYVGYHPSSNGTFQYGISMDLIPYLDDGYRDELGQAKAWEFIKNDPERIPYLMVKRLGYFWGLERRAVSYFYVNNFFGFIPNIVLIPISLVLIIPFTILSVSAVVGLASFQWKKAAVLPLLFIFGYLAPHVMILGEDRFHYALVPILAIFCALSWEIGWIELKKRIIEPYGQLIITLAMAFSILLIMNWIFEIIRDWDVIRLMFSPGGNTLYLPY